MPKNQNNNFLLKFLPPTLSEGKVWYVSYYAIYPSTGKLRRVRIKLNRIKGIGPRRSFAKKLINEINYKLTSGWNPFIEKEAPKSFYELFSVLDTYLNVRKKESEPNSYRGYKSYVKFLKDFLSKNYSNKIYVNQFDTNIASKIMLHIKQNPKYSFRTYNNYLQSFTTIFNWMLEFAYITENPFDKIKKIPKKLIKKTRRTLTENERKQLRDFLTLENKNYFVMCLLCYYCFLRPKEISLLRIKDIDVENQLVYVSEDIAKNDHSSIRTIPNAMISYVKDLDLNQSRDYYLFSFDKAQKFVPGIKIAEGREIARYWSDVVRRRLNWPMELQFYSLKDTGITNMLADGIAPNFVQGQADHSSLDMTSIYAAKRTTVSQEQIKNNSAAF